MELTTFCILTLLFYETQEIRIIIFFVRDLLSTSNYLLHEHWSFSTNDDILVLGTEFLKSSIEPYASMKQLRITMRNTIEYRVEEWRFQWNWCKCDSLYRADDLWADLGEREREREREVLIVHNIDFNGNFLDSMKDGLWLISDYMIIILKLGMLKNVRIIFVIYEMRYNL